MRRLVVCSDGTWATISKQHLTNVAKLATALRPTAPDGTDQIVFYDPGVGTGDFWNRVSGGAVGSGLYDNVKDAYTFLMNNHERGDEIYLFGFSRGAFTVRSVAGMIRKCGLLEKSHVAEFARAYDVYREGRKAGGSRGTYAEGWPDTEDARRFRESYSRKDFAAQRFQIKFIGVWDTVAALGLQLLRRVRLAGRNEFHDLHLSTKVGMAYQALAIDERRRNFQPSIWVQQDNAPDDQMLEQVWFAGCHSDVGGGAATSGLSDVALEWMIQKAEATGLVFDRECLEALKVRLYPLANKNESWKFPWFVIPPYSRKIGKVEPSREALDPSVIARYDEIDYRPKNLLDYLRRANLPPSR